MGPVGMQEMVVILLVALVLFGPKKLPELGRTVGKAITEFRRAQSELKATFETHMRELEKETQSVTEITRSYTNDIYNHYTASDYSYPESHAIGAAAAPTEANPSTPSLPAAPEPVTQAQIGQAQIGQTHIAEAPVNGTVARNIPSSSEEQESIHT